MDKTTLVEALRVNHIKVHKRFVDAACNRECISELRPLFNMVIGGMTEILIGAFNSPDGLSAGVRKTLKKLSELLVNISDKKTASEYGKIEEQAEEIISEAKNSLNSQKREGDSSMKNEVLKQINSYREGISVVISMGMAPERDDILKQCLAKLDELEGALDNILDITSADALKCAMAIKATLEGCGRQIATAMHNGRTPAMIDTAIRQAKEWAALREVKQKGFFGSKKPVNIDELRFDETYDPLAQIGQSSQYLEDINNFQANLSSYKERVSRQCDTSKETEAIQALKQEQAQLQEQAGALLTQYNNGIISAEELDDRLDANESAQDRVQDRLDTAQEKISAKQALYDAQEWVITTLDDLLSTIEEFAETDPEMIAILGEEIDFNALTNLMRGNADMEDEQSVRALEQLTEIIRRKKEVGAKAFADKMREKYRERRQEKNAEREARRAARHAEQPNRPERNREEVLARAARLAGQRPQQPQQPQQPQGQQGDEQQNPEDGMRNPVGGFRV